MSMTVVAAACATGLAVQGGMALWIALLVAAAIYAVLLSTHAVVRRAGVPDMRGGSTQRRTSAKAAVSAHPQLPPTPIQSAHDAAALRPAADRHTEYWPAHAPAEGSLSATKADLFHVRPDRADHALGTAGEALHTARDHDTHGAEFYDAELPAMAHPAPLSQRDQDFEHLQGLIRQLAFDTRDAGAQRPPAPVPAAAFARQPAPTLEDAPPNASRIGTEHRWLADAIARENVNVYLDPIQGLSERKPRHFEVSVRLLMEDGAEIKHRDVMAAARLTGMLPQLDAIKLPRVARVARRIQDSGQASAVLTSVSGESLADQIFHDAASHAIGDGQGGHLVLGYAQYEVRAFGPAHWQALTELANWGLRFALEEVVDLDMDFGLLRARGFEFVKLDAAVLLDGMPGAGGVVPPADLCRYLGELELSLIVGHIDDEWTMSQVLACGAALGQGALFGAPRPVRADVMAPDL